MNKTCNKCAVTKEYKYFYKDKGIKDGHATICKECKNKSMNKWRELNRSKYNENMRKLRATDKERFKNIDLKRTYGITLEDYNKMLVEQSYACKICKKENTSIKRTLAVDHDHVTGKVRGLLCYACNRALHTLDNIKLFETALKYIKESA